MKCLKNGRATDWSLNFKRWMPSECGEATAVELKVGDICCRFFFADTWTGQRHLLLILLIGQLDGAAGGRAVSKA